MRNSVIAITALFAVSLNAYGGDNGLYLGGALRGSTIDTTVDFFGFNIEDDDTAYEPIAGFRPIDGFAIEANYVNFGSIVFDNRAIISDGFYSEFEVQAIDVFAVAYVGGPLVEVFGKAGLVYWDADRILQGGIGGIDLRDSDSGADLVFGGGLQAQLGSLAARLEYEVFDVPDTENMDLWSLGFTWTFL